MTKCSTIVLLQLVLGSCLQLGGLYVSMKQYCIFFFVINIFVVTTDTLNISRSNQKGGREGRTIKTQKSLLYTITYIQQKTLPSINGRRPGPTDSRRCTFTRHYLQEATDPICFSTHVRCKPVLYYCLIRSCKTSKQHSLLH